MSKPELKRLAIFIDSQHYILNINFLELKSVSTFNIKIFFLPHSG